MTEMKKAQQVTMAIRNAGKVLNIRRVATSKINSKLKVWYFKIPNTHSPTVVGN